MRLAVQVQYTIEGFFSVFTNKKINFEAAVSVNQTSLSRIAPQDYFHKIWIDG